MTTNTFIKDLLTHINPHSLASLELGIVTAGFGKLAVGLTFSTAGLMGGIVAIAGYLLSQYDPGLVTTLQNDLATEINALKAKVKDIEDNIVR